MADSKVTQLPTLVTPANEDLLYVVDNPTGTPESKKIALGDLFGKVNWSVNVGVSYTFSHYQHFTSANGVVTFVANVTANNASVNNLKVVGFNTPANSNAVAEQYKVWFDADYMYVAVANNTLKRVALSSF